MQQLKPKGQTGRKKFNAEESYKIDKSSFKMRIGTGVSGGQLKSVRQNGKYETWTECFY